MEFKRDIIGEYTGSFAPSVGGNTLVVRNRTRIYESEKGHLSYVITEQVTDQHRRLTRRETYVGRNRLHQRKTEFFIFTSVRSTSPTGGGMISGAIFSSARISIHISLCSTGRKAWEEFSFV